MSIAVARQLIDFPAPPNWAAHNPPGSFFRSLQTERLYGVSRPGPDQNSPRFSLSSINSNNRTKLALSLVPAITAPRVPELVSSLPGFDRADLLVEALELIREARAVGSRDGLPDVEVVPLVRQAGWEIRLLERSLGVRLFVQPSR